MTTGDVAAWVDGTPITATEVDARMAALRSAAFGARLPGTGSAEGRNARRWVVQLLCAERIVRSELAARGRPVGQRAQGLRIDQALAVGGVAAAVLASVPGAAALLDEPSLPEDAVRGYYDRNRDLFADRAISFAAARPRIVAELTSAAADRAFSSWLEQRMESAVVLAPGYEHPADPVHADATHRH